MQNLNVWDLYRALHPVTQHYERFHSHSKRSQLPTEGLIPFVAPLQMRSRDRCGMFGGEVGLWIGLMICVRASQLSINYKTTPQYCVQLITLTIR